MRRDKTYLTLPYLLTSNIATRKPSCLNTALEYAALKLSYKSKTGLQFPYYCIWLKHFFILL